ncbi:uncharacterized protein [Cicer arietinum]|uniref:uncharacterized protein n=1 Tax=Cicer arietinum TaxID=3827 RepID=UPI0006417D92
MGRPLIMYLTVFDGSMGCMLGLGGPSLKAIHDLAYDLLDIHDRSNQKTIKGSVVADYLANQPVDDYQSIKCEFSYETWAKGILAALGSKTKVLEVHGDSALVINQLNKEWESRYKKLIPYFTFIKELSSQFDKITFHRVPRENNQLDDTLDTLSSMFQISRNDEIPSIKMESRDHPTYCHVMEEEIDGKLWYHDIKQYLINREYSPRISENEKRTLRRLTASLFVNANILYKINHDMILLKCVDVNEVKEFLQDIHDGSYGIHMNGHAMSRKIL